jgi:(p)ppGpp synthase/HD superfamily hydrolase
MKVVISDSQIKQALELVIARSGNEKRVLSPTPGQEPYWHHVVRVYAHLIAIGETDHEILVAAILHDALEDGHVTIGELTAYFGSRVAEIVNLLSEEVHTDHTFSGNRDPYFNRIANYIDPNISVAAMKIKICDRFDNLIGISYTELNDKKQQFLDEDSKYLRPFAQALGLEHLIDLGERVVRGEETNIPDINLELSFLPTMPLR